VSTVFGEVAGTYDQVRPGYPDEVAEAVLAYHGGVPAHVVELGAGTGKGTEVLLRVGAPMTCIEPDPRMTELLAANFPQVSVHLGTFEDWTPPIGAVPLIACAMAWHWLDPATRNQRAHAALAPGGTLAVFGHRYGYADPRVARAIDAAICGVDPSVRERDPGWFHDDIVGSGLFTDVRTEVVRRPLTLARQQYLLLVQTFGPFRRRSPQLRVSALEAIGAVLDELGGTVVLDLHTTLVLARRPG
jgi:SAM-dependent methyltransferase